MTDRELLELAARAAGIRLHVWGTKGQENFADMDDPGGRWNPLADDGDALRLAVKLGLSIYAPDEEDATAVVRDWNFIRVTEEGDDHCASTRRAITRAAAEIGGTK